MPSNWASFLNNASTGYDQGFDRYQQYDAARKARKVDATGREAVASRVLAEGSGGDIGFGEYESAPTALPTGEAISAAPATAVDTSAPLPTAAPHQSRGKLQRDQPPNATAGGRSVPSYTMGATMDEYTGGVLNDVMNQTTPAIKGKSTHKGPTAKDKAGAKAATAKKKAKEAKAIAVAEVQESIDDAMPLVSRTDKKQLATDARKVQGSGTSAKLWKAAENKQRDHLMAKGDYEGAANVSKNFREMRHTRGLESLKNAARLLAGDPEAAARELYTAMSNFPDGMDIDIRVGRDGTLYGYGYDEETGEFRGGMPLNLEKITELYQHFEDPVAFEQAEKAEAMASEQTSYERAEDKRDWLQKNEELSIKRLAAAAAAAHHNAQTAEIYWGEAGGAKGGAGSWDPTDLLTRQKSFSAYTKDVHGGLMPPGIASVFMNPEHASLGRPDEVGRLGQSIITNSGENSGLSNEEALDIAAELRMALLMGSGMKLEDAVDDRRWDGWLKERAAKPIVTVDGERDGNMAFTYNGKRMYVPTHVLGSMAGLYGQMKAREEATAQQAANPQPQAVSTGFSGPRGRDAGETAARAATAQQQSQALRTGIKDVFTHPNPSTYGRIN